MSLFKLSDLWGVALARQVFFSFHYKRDISRVNVVRKSGFMQQETGFIDHSLWEKSKLQGDAALRSLIDHGLKGASVTAVLIGAETAGRKWVNYEIENSWNQGMGLLGIRIHRIRGFDGRVDLRGNNPFSEFSLTGGGSLANVVSVYDWVDDDGYRNMSSWIEKAAQDRNR